jgi:hypothetical protein
VLVFLIFLSLLSMYPAPKGRQTGVKDFDGFTTDDTRGHMISKVKSPYDWKISPPGDQGMETILLENALRETGYYPYLDSVLIARNGCLVAEWYFQGRGSSDARNIRWSNAILSALVGIAIKENYLQGVDQKMLDFFPGYIYPGIDPQKYNITIEHLLTMMAGFNFEERSESDWNNWMSSADWLQYAIQLNLRKLPGEQFMYSSIHTHILSGIIAKATGMSTLEFAREYLFDPLGMSIAAWEQDPQGIYQGGWGMYFTPRDMARFGQLYIENGVVDGKSYFPGGWINQSLQEKNSILDQWFYNYIIRVWEKSWYYGYHWFFTKAGDKRVFMQAGYGGQFIVCVPALNMVVVVTANENVPWDEHEKHFSEIFSFIVLYLVDAVRDGHEPPPYPPLNIGGTKILNRSLSQVENIDIIKWDHNPQNAGANISSYRVYKIEHGLKTFLEDVDAGTVEYIYREHMFDSTPPATIFGIAAISAGDKESVAAVVTPRITGGNRDR